MHGPDKRTLHNHPWGFNATILTGGYTMMVVFEDGAPVKRRAFRVGDSYDFQPPRTDGCAPWHFIESIEPGTRTYVRAGPATNGWGFLHHRDGVLVKEGLRPRPRFGWRYIPFVWTRENPDLSTTQNIYRNPEIYSPPRGPETFEPEKYHGDFPLGERNIMIA